MKKTAATQSSGKTISTKISTAPATGIKASEKTATKPKRAAKDAPAAVASPVVPIKPARMSAKPLLETTAEVAQSLPKTKSEAAKPVKSTPTPPEEPKPKTKVDASTVVRRTYTRRKATETAEPLPIPSILLEGDEPAQNTIGGPGEKFSLGATPPAQSFTGGDLPESYGTKKLFLTARDPHWLYAHWDLTREQQNDYNGLSTDGHLVLRIFAGKIEGHPAYEIHVHPESRHWFAHVERAGNTYAAELGYYSALGKWMRIAVSSGTLTPPDAAAAESEAEYATIPFEFPFAKLMQIIEEAVRDNVPLTHAIEDLRRHGHPDLPRFSSSGLSSVAPSPSSGTTAAGPAAAAGVVGAPVSPTTGPAQTRVWTPEQERALAKIISIDETRRVWMGSLEITELIRRRLAHDVTSPVAGFNTPQSFAPAGLASASSPSGQPPGSDKPKSFWFNVNAELIIYGATEPNARVTLGGHEIKLRSDGTFSFRFALPDGKYDLPAVAISADGTDGRAAELKFVRETEYRGDVGQTPQDPALKPPLADNV